MFTAIIGGPCTAVDKPVGLVSAMAADVISGVVLVIIAIFASQGMGNLDYGLVFPASIVAAVELASPLTLIINLMFGRCKKNEYVLINK